MRKKLSFILIAVLMVSTFTGCKGLFQKDKDTNMQNPTIKVSEIKKVHNVSAVSDQNSLSPFWNVDQGTKFTLHFNSKVEPALAVSVHTDPKCEMNSRVGQLNSAFIDSEGGVDVVVKPGLAVLNEDKEQSNAFWGYAPIYYLRINYDRFSSEVKKLDTPIIVPFTVRANMSTPTLYGKIDNNGQFYLTWTKVDNATSYEIYESSVGLRSETNDKIADYTRSELGYKGDHLTKIAEVSETSFNGFSYNAGEKSYIENNGNIVYQNSFVPLTYFIRAKNANGEVGNFSMAVESWKYMNRMPDTVEVYDVNELPETLNVRMKDGSTIPMPVNFKKDSEETNRVKYNYTIPGTLLTGYLYLNKTEGVEAPNEKNSNIKQSGGLYEIQNSESIIPVNTVDILSDAQKEIISEEAGEGKKALSYSEDMRLAVAEMENVRLLNKGLYNKTIEDLINEYGSIYGKEESIPQENNNVQEQQPQPQDNPTSTDPIIPPANSDNNTNNTDNNTNNNNNETNNQPTEQKPVETPTPQEETPSTDENNVDENVVDENNEENITENNNEEENLEEETNIDPEIEEGNQQEIPNTEYPIFADSAEEEYLARMMVNGEEIVSVAAFPRLQDTTYLIDAWTKVYFQNPYVISPEGIATNIETKEIKLSYQLSKEEMAKRQAEIQQECKNILSSTITDSMSDDEKIKAIWDKMEEDTVYDDDALTAAEESGFSVVDPSFADSFNAYGIICKKKGVCQSYAYAYKLLLSEAGINAKVLTGFLNGNLPHGWNIVQTDGGWYWFDLTNNAKTLGVPYMLYEASSEFANSQAYTADEAFDIDDNLSWINSNDNSKTFYSKKNLIVNTASEIPNKIVEARKYKKFGAYAIFVKNGITESDFTQDLMNGIAKSLMTTDISQEALQGTKIMSIGNFVVFLEGR